VMDDRERLRSILKSDVREFTISKTSPMPSYKATLSQDELADLLGYLLSLKGQQPWLAQDDSPRAAPECWLACSPCTYTDR